MVAKQTNKHEGVFAVQVRMEHTLYVFSVQCFGLNAFSPTFSVKNVLTCVISELKKGEIN